MLLIIPTMGVISLLAFFIGINSPLDPVEGEYLKILEGKSLLQVEKDITKLVAEEGLDKATFYFSIPRIGAPDTLHKIYFRKEKRAAESLFAKHGHWKEIESIRKQLKWLQKEFDEGVNPTSLQIVSNLLLLDEWLPENLLEIDRMIQAYSHKDTLQSSTKQGAIDIQRQSLIQLREKIQGLLNKRPEWYSFLPGLAWHGTDNRYHRWISRAIKLDFGTSWVTKQKVAKNWNRFVGMTLRFTILATIIAYGIAIGLGIWLAVNWEKITAKWTNGMLIVIDAIPSFWLATLLLIFFANPHFCDCFSATYQPDHPDYRVELQSMVMPLITYVLGMLTVLTRLMKTSMQAVLHQDYVRTAKAKGLPSSTVIWKHALRNALIPLLATLASIFVWLLSGSVIVERIFSIPGLGDKILLGLESGDIPVIMMVFTLGGLFTALGYLLTDLLNIWVDPRIKVGKKHG